MCFGNLWSTYRAPYAENTAMIRRPSIFRSTNWQTQFDRIASANSLLDQMTIVGCMPSSVPQSGPALQSPGEVWPSPIGPGPTSWWPGSPGFTPSLRMIDQEATWTWESPICCCDFRRICLQSCLLVVTWAKSFFRLLLGEVWGGFNSKHPRQNPG